MKTITILNKENKGTNETKFEWTVTQIFESSLEKVLHSVILY